MLKASWLVPGIWFMSPLIMGFGGIVDGYRPVKFRLHMTAKQVPGEQASTAEITRKLAAQPEILRDQLVEELAEMGMVAPASLDFKVIHFDDKDRSGKVRRVSISISSDYFALGSATDPLYVPLRPGTAQAIADHFGSLLPTTKLVDKIYQHAQVKYKPQSIAPSAKMASLEYALHHRDLIEQHRSAFYGAPGSIYSGHKKDIVITQRLKQRPGRVAIYGWHRPDARPIQPLSLVHDDQYADYSHGMRMVQQKIYIDGTPHLLEDVLRDPNLSLLVSYEGVVEVTRYPKSSGPAQPVLASSVAH